jgi:hypothetical protein
MSNSGTVDRNVDLVPMFSHSWIVSITFCTLESIDAN